MKKVNEFLKSKLTTSGFTQKLTEEELLEALEANSTFINDNGENELKLYFQEKYREYSLTIDCLIHWYITLTVSLLSKYSNFIDGITNNAGYCTQILFTLTNNLIALKYLFENGLDTQAKSVFRNSIELTDLALIVLYDNNYFLTHSSPQRKDWWNPFVSPKNNTLANKAKEIVVELYRTDSTQEDKNEINSLKTIWDTIRNGQYEILSENSHGNYIHNIFNAFKLSDDHGNYVPSIGGQKWRNLDRTLSDICLHQIASRRHITWTLKLKHNIDLFDNTVLEHRFIFFLDTVLGELLPKIAEGQSKDYIDIGDNDDDSDG
jgi:hypothetical protein